MTTFHIFAVGTNIYNVMTETREEAERYLLVRHLCNLIKADVGNITGWEFEEARKDYKEALRRSDYRVFCS